MKPKKLMIIAALIAGNLVAWNVALRAQISSNTPPAGAPPAGQRPPGMRGGPSLDQLAQTLKLTDDQKAKVKPILEAQQQKIRALRQDTSLSPEDRRTQMQTIHQDTSTQLKPILTTEQFEKYQQMTQRRRPGGPPPAPAAPPQT